MTIDRARFARAVADHSPLTIAQIERLFGGEVTAANKALVWRFLQIEQHQQQTVWAAVAVLRCIAPEVQVEAVSRL